MTEHFTAGQGTYIHLVPLAITIPHHSIIDRWCVCSINGMKCSFIAKRDRNLRFSHDELHDRDEG